tara:strand:+ start:1799 stop:2152 length:354 start_codon:yes stop_codon:yes gene_type:complete
MSSNSPQNRIEIIRVDQLEDRQPAHALVENTDLVIIKYDNQISVLYGRCVHRGALMSDGKVSGENIVCGVHNWDYRLDSGVSEYDNKEKLHKFNHLVEDGVVFVDRAEVIAFEEINP